MMTSNTGSAPAADFPGRERLIGLLDEAVQAHDAAAVTGAVKNMLAGLIRVGGIELPRICHETRADHYRRHELYRSERYGYSVVAMTWAPGQGTAVHDHAGLWCVEGVCDGCLEVEQYDVTGRDEDRYHLVRQGNHVARTGTAGSLIPPYEYHSITNTSAAEPAVSLHVYERAMTACHVFEPLGGSWFKRVARRLEVDA